MKGVSFRRQYLFSNTLGFRWDFYILHVIFREDDLKEKYSFSSKNLVESTDFFDVICEFLIIFKSFELRRPINCEHFCEQCVIKCYDLSLDFKDLRCVTSTAHRYELLAGTNLTFVFI